MPLTRRERQFFIAAAILTIISAILYCSWPLGFWLNPQVMHGGLASELGAFGQPYNWVFIAGDIVSGALLAAGVGLLLRTYKFTGWALWALILLAIYGICGAIDAALPLHCLPSETACGSVFADPLLVAHGVCDLLGSTALLGTLVATAMVVRGHNHWTAWIWAIGVGGSVFAILSGIVAIWGGPGYWTQRYYITLSCLWVGSIPFVLRPKQLTELTAKVEVGEERGK